MVPISYMMRRFTWAITKIPFSIVVEKKILIDPFQKSLHPDYPVESEIRQYLSSEVLNQTTPEAVKAVLCCSSNRLYATCRRRAAIVPDLRHTVNG